MSQAKKLRGITFLLVNRDRLILVADTQTQKEANSNKQAETREAKTRQ